MENQSGEALLDLGQVCQLVEDLGVVKHAAELLRTHAVSVCLLYTSDAADEL